MEKGNNENDIFSDLYKSRELWEKVKKYRKFYSYGKLTC